MDPVGARVLRGDVVESVHRVSVAVVDPAGRLVASFGDPELVTFARSSIKTVQALPLFETGAVERFGLDDEALAIACSSHGGEPRHVQAVARLLNTVGLGARALACGAHAPYDAAAALQVGGAFTSLHNNCSGKHAGMLASCKAAGWKVSGYLRPAHPLQRRIRALMAEEAGVPARSLATATDGCSAPNFALPLRRTARIFARLMAAEEVGGERGAALGRLRDAMLAHPFLVAGTNRSDTRVMEALDGRVWVKAGGEACYGIGLRKAGLGVAVKVEDGASRAMPSILLRLLGELGALTASDRRALAGLAEPIRNVRGLAVGRIESDLRLRRPTARAP